MLAALRQRNIALYWIGQCVSLFGDWLLIIALPFYIYQLTGSILQTGLMFVVEMLPQFFLGPLAGVLVDRWDRRWTMIVSNLLGAGAVLPLLLIHSRHEVWLVYVVQILFALFPLFFRPASNALIPSLVDQEGLVAVNALSSFNDAISRLVGPLLGGFLFALQGINAVVIIDGITYLFAAFMIALISVPLSQNGTANQKKEKTTMKISPFAVIEAMWSEWLDGLNLVRQKQVISGIILTNAIFYFAGGILNSLLAPFVKNVMHANAFVLGELTTAIGVGGLVGSLLIHRISKAIRPSYLIIANFAVTGGIILTFANYPLLALLLPLFTFIGLFNVGYAVTVQTLLQSNVTDTHRGRVFGFYGTVSSFATLAGFLLTSFLGDRLGVVLLLNVSGCSALFAVLVSLIVLRNARFKQNDLETEQEILGNVGQD